MARNSIRFANSPFHVIGNTRLSAAHAVPHPFFWQVECAIQKRCPLAASIQKKHPNLAVFLPACCATVLPRHPRRFLAFLHKARFIDHQDPTVLPQVLDDVRLQVITHSLFIPIGLSQEPLHPAWTSFA